MVRMDKLLDAWRADPRVEPTVELCAMLTRACMKPGARNVIPMAFVVALATEAIIKHPRSVEVLLALATLYHAAGEMRAASTVLQKAKVFAGDDQRVIDLSEKVRKARATQELVSDLAPRQLAPVEGGSLRPSPASLPPPSEKPASKTPVEPVLDAETFDAPTTPLDPPTEPGKLEKSDEGGHPRRAMTTHGLAPPPDLRPFADSEPPRPLNVSLPSQKPAAGSPSNEPTDPNPRRSRTLLGGSGMLAAPQASPLNLTAPKTSRGEAPSSVRTPPSTGRATTFDDDDSGPSTTVDKIFTANEPQTAQRDVPQIPLRPPPKTGRGPALDPRTDEPLTSQREVPQMPPRNEGQTTQRDVPHIPSRPPRDAAYDEPLTQQRDVPQIPTRNPSSMAPPRSERQGLAISASQMPPPSLRPPVPPAPLSQSATAVGEQPGGFNDEQKTSTRVGPPPDAEMNRPAARRLAARKPGGRGVGTDDPLMKAALARRARLGNTGSGQIPDDNGPATHAQHDVPTRAGLSLGTDDARPTRNLIANNDAITVMGRGGAGAGSMADPESAPTRTRTGPLPITAKSPASDRSTTTRGPQSDRALTARGPASDRVGTPASDRTATSRGPAIPHMMGDISTARGPAFPQMGSHETTQTEVDSVSEDAPTRTLSGAPPMTLPEIGVQNSLEQETSDSDHDLALPDPDTASTFSKVVTQRWQPGAVPVPRRSTGSGAAWSGPPPSAPPTGDDSVDTHLRPLAPLARPLMKPAQPRPLPPPKQAAPTYGAPRVHNESDEGPGTYVMKPEESAAASRRPFAPPKPEPIVSDDEGPGTYVMRADEAQAAARINPLAGSYSGLRSEIHEGIDPLDILDDDSHGGGPAPLPLSFGQQPSPFVTRGVAFGAGTQASTEMRPLDFDIGNMASGLPALDQSSPSGGLDLGISAPAGFSNAGYGDQPRGFGQEGDLGSQRPRVDEFSAPNDSFGSPQYQSPYESARPFPTDASYPSSDDGLPPINFDPIPIPTLGEAQAFPSNAPPHPSMMPPPVIERPGSDAEVRRRPVGLYVALAVAALMVAVLVGYASFLVISDYKRTGAPQASKPTTDAEQALLLGTPSDIARADGLLVELEKNPSRDIDITRVRLEALRSLEVSGKEEGLGPAIDAAHAAGATSEVVCGEIALALAQQDPKKVDAIIAKEDAGLAKDPFYQLAVGVALEARGDIKSLERYDAAFAAEPQFAPARVRAIRSMLLDGDRVGAQKRLGELPDSASRTALQALAWVAGRAAGASETVARPKTLPTTAEVPRELLPAYAATSLIDAEKGDPSTLTKRGIDEADSPAVAVLFGHIALNRGDVTSAAAAARRALTMGPSYAPGLRLLGRTAVEVGKFDIMKEILATLPEESTRELRSLRAYEMGDLEDLTAIAAKVPEGAPEKLVVTVRLDRLRGADPIGDERISRLMSSDALGADLCAVDALLDRGNLSKAKELIGHWTDATTQPLRARRYARLMRYEGNLDEALLALGGATTTVPTASLERMILDAEIPKHRQEALDLLSESPSPLDIPPATVKLLQGYIKARNDDGKAAKELLEGAQVPSKQTALPTRVCAALAFGEVKDKRAEALVKDLFAAFPQNPDVLRAAQELGVSDPVKP